MSLLDHLAKTNVVHHQDYKGVYYCGGIYDDNDPRSSYVWRAELPMGKSYKIACGYFTTAKDAALARDRMIIKTGSKEALQVLKPLSEVQIRAVDKDNPALPKKRKYTKREHVDKHVERGKSWMDTALKLLEK